MKRPILLFSLGIFGGIFASLFYFNFYLADFLISQSELQDNLKAYLAENKLDALTSPASSINPDFWQKIVNDSSISTVAIQVFSNNKLNRQGSGIILSNDGVIATSSNLIIPNAIFQVFVNDKIVRAEVVHNDVSKNLAFLKVKETGLTVASLDFEYNYKSGKDVIVSGKLTELSGPVNFSQRALISYVTDKDVILDTNLDKIINGSIALDSNGIILGMTYIKNNKVHLLSARIIGEALSDFLNKNNE